MPEHNMQEQLRRTVRYVVETMCFSEVAAADERLAGADTIVTTVNFYGSRTGRLKLEVSSSAAWSLTDAFLGDPEPAADAPEALVSELGTMICGRFLSAVDPLGELSLTKAEVKQEMNRAGEQVWENFALESGQLSASVEFDQE